MRWQFTSGNRKAWLRQEITCLSSALLWVGFVCGAEADPISKFHKEIQPILSQYCYDCHGDGMDKGGVAFDQLKGQDLAAKPELWSKVLRNLRAGLMPPEKKPRPTPAELQKLES